MLAPLRRAFIALCAFNVRKWRWARLAGKARPNDMGERVEAKGKVTARIFLIHPARIELATFSVLG